MYQIKKLLIATHNPAKIKEISIGLDPLSKKGMKLLTLNDLKINQDTKETGKTFKENSILKAKFYTALTSLPSVADDGGLIIPYLNNEPGVKSKRWLGYDASDEELIQYTLKRLESASKSDRTAYLQTCICFYKPEQNPQVSGNPEGFIIFCEQEKIKGHIAEKPSPRRVPGFPYRALLIVDEFNKYYDELTEDEHHKINHRLKALNRLVKRIDKYLLE